MVGFTEEDLVEHELRRDGQAALVACYDDLSKRFDAHVRMSLQFQRTAYERRWDYLHRQAAIEAAKNGRTIVVAPYDEVSEAAAEKHREKYREEFPAIVEFWAKRWGDTS